MKKQIRSSAALGLLTLLAAVLALGIYLRQDSVAPDNDDARNKVLAENKRRAKVQKKKRRNDYFFSLLRDPETNRIPENIRMRELEHARRLPTAEMFAGKTGAVTFTWAEAGPSDVGGRTRALAMDVTNPNILLAGAASGGIWKSTNGGRNWSFKSDPSGQLSVTWLAQDTRPGETNTWYYSSGEYSGSGGDQGSTASFFGAGLYKSIDRGDSWQPIQSAGDPTSFDSPFDYISKVVVNPASGSVFLASNAFGILRSEDGGASFDIVLGGANDHEWSDIDVTVDGDLVAVLSFGNSEEPANEPGIYLSSDDGVTWTNQTPDSFPDYHSRSVLATAPSNAGVAYVLTWTGDGEGSSEDVRFHKLNLLDGTSEDRTANLPNFEAPVGHVDTQGAYNMVIAVKPDDEDFVVFGTTNLWRSRDGFATPADDVDENWIGGYASSNDISKYENQHPDQQSLVFGPEGTLLSGHDGGLSRTTTDITAGSITWESLNNGYNVTQYYALAVGKRAEDTRLLGGTQDNGSPYFRFDGQTATASSDVSTGDGSYAYLGSNYGYVSTQNGDVTRVSFTDTKDIDPDLSTWSSITPEAAEGMLFINPFAVDPVDEDVMYFLAGDVIWRNDQLSSIPDYEEKTSIGWTELDDLRAPAEYSLSTISVSTTPAHVLYYGASHFDLPPKIYRLEDANTATTGAVDISVPDAADGAYVHSIAVNPNDANEILVAFSNYNVVSLFHSTDGGQSYVAVEGNLDGTDSEPGPSIRSAAILPLDGETVYVVGTSTGLYSTSDLGGDDGIVWMRQADETIGSTIINYIVARPSDGKIFAATHGRGIFVGTPDIVQPVNQAPAFTASLGDVMLTAGETLTFTYIATDANDDAVVFELFDGPEGAELDAATGTLSWTTTSADVGTHTIIVDAIEDTDDGLSARATSTVTVASNVDVEDGVVPLSFGLAQNFPNPFNPSTKVSFVLSESSVVSLAVFDVSGRKVADLVNASTMPIGQFSVDFNAHHLASGIYIYTLRASPVSGGAPYLKSMRMSLVK